MRPASYEHDIPEPWIQCFDQLREWCYIGVQPCQTGTLLNHMDSENRAKLEDVEEITPQTRTSVTIQSP